MDIIPIIMEDRKNNEPAQNEVILSVKRSTPKFKAGADLSKTVNSIDIDCNEDQTDTHEVLEVKIHLH